MDASNKILTRMTTSISSIAQKKSWTCKRTRRSIKIKNICIAEKITKPFLLIFLYTGIVNYRVASLQKIHLIQKRPIVHSIEVIC